MFGPRRRSKSACALSIPVRALLTRGKTEHGRDRLCKRGAATDARRCLPRRLGQRRHSGQRRRRRLERRCTTPPSRATGYAGFGPRVSRGGVRHSGYLHHRSSELQEFVLFSERRRGRVSVSFGFVLTSSAIILIFCLKLVYGSPEVCRCVRGITHPGSELCGL